MIDVSLVEDFENRHLARRHIFTRRRNTRNPEDPGYHQRRIRHDLHAHRRFAFRLQAQLSAAPIREAQAMARRARYPSGGGMNRKPIIHGETERTASRPGGLW